MLTVMRRVGEKIMIDGGTITVAVLGIVGPKVKVGIEAPKHITVDREEVYLQKKSKGSREP